MAKTIKFNLICNDKPIRNIDNLQDNFVIDDIIEYYHNGLLQRWLKVRGYEEELLHVESIDTTLSDTDIIKQLVAIFDIEKSESKIDEGIYIWTFRKEREKQYTHFEEIEHSRDGVLNEYSKGYRELCACIFDNPDDAPLIKASIKDIVNSYMWLFELNHRDFFYQLLSKDHKLAILCLLMNEKARKYYLPIKTKDSNCLDVLDINLPTQEGKDKKAMFDVINDIIKELEKDKKNTLGGNIKRNDIISENYWTPICEKECKCLILSMKTDDKIRSISKMDVYGYKVPKGDSCIDIFCDENKFMLLDGLEYQTKSYSTANSRGLLYMKV